MRIRTNDTRLQIDLKECPEGMVSRLKEKAFKSDMRLSALVLKVLNKFAFSDQVVRK